MTTITILILTHAAAFVAGLLVYRHNAKKAARLEAKGKAVLDAVKG